MRPDTHIRTKYLTHSPTLAVNQRVAEARAMGFEVVHLGFGQSPFPPPKAFVGALVRHAGDNRFLPSQGLPELREAAANYLGWRFGHNASADRIMVGPGSKELIFDLLMVLEGDLLLPVPSWVSYAPQARILHKRIIDVRTDAEAGYRVGPDAIEAACRKSDARQRILILNSPCNPTGAVYKVDEVKAIAAAAAEQNIIVIADEIYAEITFGKGKYASIAAYAPDRTIVTTSLSKGFSAGGHRLGVLLLPDGMEVLMPHLAALASETFSCVCAPIQHAAIVALSENKEVRQHVEDCAAIHELATDYLYRGLAKLKLRCPKPEGAYYLFPDFSPFAERFKAPAVSTDAEICADLLDKEGVAMLPGSAFGMWEEALAVRVAAVDYDGEAALKAYQKKKPAKAADKKKFVEKHCPNLAEGLKRLGEYLKVKG